MFLCGGYFGILVFLNDLVTAVNKIGDPLAGPGNP